MVRFEHTSDVDDPQKTTRTGNPEGSTHSKDNGLDVDVDLDS